MVIYFVSEMAKETGAACASAAIGSTHVKVPIYADDVVIIRDNAKDLPTMLHRLITTFQVAHENLYTSQVRSFIIGEITTQLE